MSQYCNRMFLCAEGKVAMEIHTTKLVDGFIHLMAMYYVFDVNYPKYNRSTFFFMQDVLMGMPDDNPRPTRYSTFLSNHLNM